MTAEEIPDSDAPIDPDASPFTVPTLMHGYPLDQRERRAVAAVLDEYRREHGAQRVAVVPRPAPSR